MKQPNRKSERELAEWSDNLADKCEDLRLARLNVLDAHISFLRSADEILALREMTMCFMRRYIQSQDGVPSSEFYGRIENGLFSLWGQIDHSLENGNNLLKQAILRIEGKTIP